MAGVIYLATPEGLLAMESRPYDLESMLQELLASDARLLGGASTGDAARRRWILHTREGVIYGASGQAWSADHVFVDDEGVPTVVEVKRGTNTQIRREIVGQLLDYTSNLAASTTAEEIRTRFEGRLVEGSDSEIALQQALRIDMSADEYWALVGENLARGRIRGYFVADVIPEELRRIVDYLNQQVGESRFLALEVQQFQTADRTTTTLVPQIVAGSLDAQVAQGTRPQSDTDRLHLEFWTQFRDYLERRGSQLPIPRPAAQSLRYLPIGGKDFRLAPFNLMVRDISGVELQMRGPDATAHFALIEQVHRQLIQERLGPFGEVDWLALVRKITVTRSVSAPSDRETWPGLNEWMANTLEAMYLLFGSLVEDLDASADVALGTSEPAGVAHGSP